MKKPLLMRMAPPSWRTWIYYHLYRSRKDRWPGIYESAELHEAPGIFMKLSPTDEGHGLMAFGGMFEWSLTKEIVGLGRQGGLMVDVGANYGYFSLLWAAQKLGNRVIAFEASPRNQPLLRENIQRNGLTDVISLRTEAAGKEAGRLSFHLGPAEQTGWGGLVQDGSKGADISVPVVTLDEQLKGIPMVDVLKIDTEGADTWVLEGCQQLLKGKRIRHIFFEEHKGRMANLNIERGKAISLLSDHGYSVRVLDGEDSGTLVEYAASAVAACQKT